MSQAEVSNVSHPHVIPCNLELRWPVPERKAWPPPRSVALMVQMVSTLNPTPLEVQPLPRHRNLH